MATASVPSVPRSRIEPTLPMPAERGRPAPGAAYFRNDKSPFLWGWRPSLREQSEDVRASWQLAAARVTDSVQNSGFIAGIVDASTAGVVGPGLALVLTPDAKALGWSEDRTNSWVEYVEGRFNAWANDPRQCDAGGRMTVGMMQQLAYKSWFVFGEILALLPMFRRDGALGLTRVLMLPPTRLSQQSNPFERTVQGVKIDHYGAPVSYLIERTNQYGFKDHIEIQANDRDGRRNVVHVFEPSLGATRGMSPLTPVLKVVKQFDQIADATVTAALLQTIFAATVKTNLTGQTAFEGMLTEKDQGKGNLLEAFGELKGEWYDGAKIDFSQHGRVAHLFPNDELNFHGTDHPSQNYDQMIAWLNREICKCAGVSYTTGTGDSRNDTYSSTRMQSALEWNIVEVRRNNIVVPTSDAIFDAWLEEEIGSGRIAFPGGFDAFMAQRVAATQRYWNGPPKPQADDLKTARANETLKNIGCATLQNISADYAWDWRRQADQKKRERDYYARLGLPDPYPELAPTSASAGNKDGGDPPDDPPAKQQAA